jgi:molybdopterin converting factor subunit 1
MRVRVRLFAVLRDAAGTAELELDAAPGATVADVAELVGKIHPALARHLPRVAYAVNRNYVQANVTLSEGDEVALIPPVSGGC